MCSVNPLDEKKITGIVIKRPVMIETYPPNIGITSTIEFFLISDALIGYFKFNSKDSFPIMSLL